MTASPTDDTPPALGRRQILMIMAGLMTGMLLAALDQTILATAMPTIVGQLGGLEHYAWVITAYLLTSTASTPLYGKISDLYGRKPVLMFAIGTFVVGSLLAGVSQQMWQLIATRALQGVGAGGLMTMAFIIISEVVSPRERAKYQGLFGAVFGLSSVAGPLLGGYFAEHNWRWIFFLNLPLGILALGVVSTVLTLPTKRREHAVDYVGAGLLVAGVSALLLMLSWGGNEYAWSSGVIVGLGAAGVVLATVFVWWESRAAEPILPLRMFAGRTFSLANIGAFVMSMAMFGAIVYIPLYLQIVKERSPSVSGLLMLPLMVGVLGASIVGGRVISKVGRYKWSLVAGAVVMIVGLVLFTRLVEDTPLWLGSVYMLVVGIGTGMLMQPFILAVQNDLPPADLGAGTSAVTFFRQLGGSFGVAIFGAIFNNRLAHWLERTMPTGDGAPSFSGELGDPQAILRLPDAVKDAVQDAFVHTLHPVFWTAAGVAVLALVVAVLIPDHILREGHRDGPEATEAKAQEPAGVG